MIKFSVYLNRRVFVMEDSDRKAQSDQSLRCPLKGALELWLPIECSAKTDHMITHPVLPRGKIKRKNSYGRPMHWLYRTARTFFAKLTSHSRRRTSTSFCFKGSAAYAKIYHRYSVSKDRIRHLGSLSGIIWQNLVIPDSDPEGPIFYTHQEPVKYI